MSKFFETLIHNSLQCPRHEDGESIYFAKDFDIILSKLALCLLCMIFVYLFFLLDFHDFNVYF